MGELAVEELRRFFGGEPASTRSAPKCSPASRNSDKAAARRSSQSRISRMALFSPPPGTLYLRPGQPNSKGARDAALLSPAGDATAGRSQEIIPAAGVQAPTSFLPLDRPTRIKLLHFNDFPVTSQVSRLWRCACFLAHRSLASRDARPPMRTIRGWPCWLRRAEMRAGLDFRRAPGGRARIVPDPCLDITSTPRRHRCWSACNHDLDRGAGLLAHAIRQDAQFPLLAANMTGSQSWLHAVSRPHSSSSRVRVGFIGLITPAQIHPNRIACAVSPIRWRGRT